MKILLINNNPLVSRMLALCTRDEDIVLDEVKRVDGIDEENYDLLFVDDASYVDQVDVLLEEGRIRQKVFISYSANDVKGFDETIRKPFLPSQIINVIENVELPETGDMSLEKDSIFPLEIEGESEDQIELPDIFPLPVEVDETPQEEILEEEEPELQKEDEVEEWKLALEEEDDTEVLDSNEIEKIKALLDMDDEEDLALGLLSEEDYEARKVEVITEQLMADGLEIVEEEEIIDVLSVKNKAKPVDKRKKSKSKSEEKNKEKKKKSKKKKKKASKFTKDELGSIEEAVTHAIESLDPKKMKKLLKGKEIGLNIKLEDDD